MKIKFLAKPIANFPTTWTICTTEEEFNTVQDKLVDRGYHDAWTVSSTYDGVTHFYDRLVVLCVPLDVSLSVLVHEAVHVFEAMMRDAGEESPGEEIRAYCTQFIFDTALAEMVSRRQAIAKKTEVKHATE